MRLGEPAKMQAAINITPLVDVVLVLLIIFMVMAPRMMRKGPEVPLPHTAKPSDQGDERGRVLVTMDSTGGIWIDDQQVPPERFAEGLIAAVGDEPDPKIVIKGDARLKIGDVRAAMLAIEAAGFPGVGLIAKPNSDKAGGE